MRSTGAPTDPPWASGQVSERAWCQLCPNPSPMTLDGTNTWIVTEPGARESVVIDPGPTDEAHLSAVLAHVDSLGSRVALTLLTHHHEDHAQSAGRFAELTSAPIRAAGAGHGDLGEGDRVEVAGLELLVAATPGHTGDSLSFLLTAEQRLLTGDTILGRGTTVVAHPDGELAAYLASLERLARLTGSGEVTSLAPGHGPAVADAAGVVEFYLAHRAERLDQVRRAVAEIKAQLSEPDSPGLATKGDLAHTGRTGSGDLTQTGLVESADLTERGVVESGDLTEGGVVESGDLADMVVRRVYADTPVEVWPAARLSVLAQLDYLGLG